MHLFGVRQSAGSLRHSGAGRVRGSAWAIAALLPLCAPLQAWADVPPGSGVLDAAAVAIDNPERANYETVTRAGSRLVAGGEHGLIILSDDNGKSWRQANVPVSATILQIGFATPQTGWAIGAFGVVLHTADGGQSWTLQLDGIKAAQIMVAAAQAASPPPPTASANPVAPPVASGTPPAPVDPTAPADPTAVAGADAAPVVPQRLRRARSFAGDGPDKPFFVLEVIDADHARVIGAYDMAFETADGGKSWTEWDQRIDDTGDLHPYAMSGSGASTVLAGERGLLVHGDPATGMKAVATPPYDGSYFGALDAGSAGSFVFGLLGHLYRSTDGGSTWNQIQNPSTATLTCGLVLDGGKVAFADISGAIWRLDGNAITLTAARRPWPITSMVQAADGSMIVAGLGGVSRIDRTLLDSKPAIGG